MRVTLDNDGGQWDASLTAYLRERLRGSADEVARHSLQISPLRRAWPSPNQEWELCCTCGDRQRISVMLVDTLIRMDPRRYIFDCIFDHLDQMAARHNDRIFSDDCSAAAAEFPLPTARPGSAS